MSNDVKVKDSIEESTVEGVRSLEALRFAREEEGAEFARRSRSGNP